MDVVYRSIQEEPVGVDHEETVGVATSNEPVLVEAEAGGGEGCNYVYEYQLVEITKHGVLDLVFSSEELEDVVDMVDGSPMEQVPMEEKHFVEMAEETVALSMIKTEEPFMDYEEQRPENMEMAEDTVGLSMIKTEEPSMDYEEQHPENLVYYEQYESSPGEVTVSSCKSEPDEDPEWNVINQEFIGIEVKKKRKYTRRKNSTVKAKSLAKDKSTSTIRKSIKKPRGQGRKQVRFDFEQDENSNGLSSTPRARRGTAEHGRPRTDVTSFRFKMGPHLRTLSAVLEITGLKRVSDSVPYDVIRRFHPTDMYRTVDKCIQSLAVWGKSDDATVKDVEPDWDQMAKYAELSGCDSPTEELNNDDDPPAPEARVDRVYYKSPLGFQNEGPYSVISLRQEWEENGKLKSIPDVLSGVGSAELNVALNLKNVAQKCINTEFKATDDSLGPLLMRLKEPKCTGLLYESGRLQVIGVKSFEEFRIATRKFARMVQKTGANVRLNNLKVHFYIGLVNLPFKVNIEAMTQHENLSKYLLYDGNIFSGAIIQMKDSPILCVVFNSGAILMTEATGQADMKTALDKIYPTLRLFGYQG